MASYAGFFAILPVISDSARSKLDEIDEKANAEIERIKQEAAAKVRVGTCVFNAAVSVVSDCSRRCPVSRLSTVEGPLTLEA